MADTIENLTMEDTLGKSWKSRFQNKWPTMTNLMQQSEITIQPYIHEYTDPHEIMAYQTCKIPDWDGTSQASWSAVRPIQQDMLEELSSSTVVTKETRRRGKWCATTCRKVACFVLILSVVMVAAAAIGLTIFLNLQDRGFAENGVHNHGGHINSNITTDQTMYLSKLFCKVVVEMLRDTDFPVERGLHSCHTALLFVENSDDVHIEMHVSPKEGYTIKEKIIRALSEEIATVRSKPSPGNMNKPVFGSARVREDTTVAVTGTSIPKSDRVSTTQLDSARTWHSTKHPGSFEISTQSKEIAHTTDSSPVDASPEHISSVGTTRGVVALTKTSPTSVKSSNISSTPSNKSPSIVVPSESPSTSIPDEYQSTYSSNKQISTTSAREALWTTEPGENTSTHVQIGNEFKPTMGMTGTSSTVSSNVQEELGNQFQARFSRGTTHLPPIIVPSNHMNFGQSGENNLGKTTVLPKSAFDNRPNIQETTRTHHETKHEYKTTLLPPIHVKDRISKMPLNFPVKLNGNTGSKIAQTTDVITPLLQQEKTTSVSKPEMASNSRNGTTTETEPANLIQIPNIPIATKLFNPEALGIEETSVIANANSRGVDIKSTRNQSPKIVESLMSGGVMKLPFKTNSNFRFLFSSDSKSKSPSKSSTSEKASTNNIRNTMKFTQVDNTVPESNSYFKNAHSKRTIENRPSNFFTLKPKSPESLRTLRLPMASTKSFLQRKSSLPKTPKRRLDLTTFGKQNVTFS